MNKETITFLSLKYGIRMTHDAPYGMLVLDHNLPSQFFWTNGWLHTKNFILTHEGFDSIDDFFERLEQWDRKHE